MKKFKSGKLNKFSKLFQNNLNHVRTTTKNDERQILSTKNQKILQLEKILQQIKVGLKTLRVHYGIKRRTKMPFGF